MPSTRTKRKANQLSELIFDPTARQEYLTGFHKRKEQRKKQARDAAIKLEKVERLRDRQALRDQRKLDLEKHIIEINAEIQKQTQSVVNDESAFDGGISLVEPWDGIDDDRNAAMSGLDDTYVDEDKYTTITVEPLELAQYPTLEDQEVGRSDKSTHTSKAAIINGSSRSVRTPVKRKKFRYESKAERQATRQKQNRNSRAAKARRQDKG